MFDMHACLFEPVFLCFGALTAILAIGGLWAGVPLGTLATCVGFCFFQMAQFEGISMTFTHLLNVLNALQRLMKYVSLPAEAAYDMPTDYTVRRHVKVDRDLAMRLQMKQATGLLLAWSFAGIRAVSLSLDAADGKPVGKVVALLETMSKKLEEDQKADEDMKETGFGDKLTGLKATVEELPPKIDMLSTQIRTSTQDLNSNKATVEKANAIREQQRTNFQEDNASLTLGRKV
eukprot:s522_g2.t1